MWRRSAFCLLVLAASLAAVGHPAYVPLDPPIAFIQGDPGRSTLVLTGIASAWTATLSRSVADFCDIAARVGTSSPFELLARIALPGTFPLHLEGEVGWRRATALGGVSLGPYRLVATRTWGQDAETQLTAHAANARFAVAVGVTLDPRPAPFISVTWFPAAALLWALSLTADAGGLWLTMGGTW